MGIQVKDAQNYPNRFDQSSLRHSTVKLERQVQEEQEKNA